MAQFHFSPTSGVNSVQSQQEFNLASALGESFRRFLLRSGVDPINHAKWLQLSVTGDALGSGLSSQGRVTGTAISNISANQIGVVSPVSIVIGHNLNSSDMLEIQYAAQGERAQKL